MLITTTINAGTRLEFFEPGDFFRIMNSEYPVDLEFYNQGAELVKAQSVREGYSERFNEKKFDRYAITSTQTQTIQFVARLGNVVGYDTPPEGTVKLVDSNGNIINENGPFTQSQKTVTSTSALMLAAKGNRRYLLIQNNDASGDIYINLTGATANTASGIKIEAGGSYECQGFAPTAEIHAIGSIASNSNIIAVEG
jgi:hypothetical protein